MNKKGFTLTEILIVMVVAGILLALILPNTLKAIERANVTQVKNDVNSIKVAVMMCYTEKRDWNLCDSNTELTTASAGSNPFLASYPVHPFSGGTYTISTPAGVDGRIVCGSSGTNIPADARGYCK